MEYIVSGWKGRSYAELLGMAIEQGPVNEILGAVAYATVGGVKLLEETLAEGLGSDWPRVKKKWLVGIDWCRSDPPGLDRLTQIPNSSVRVPNGESVVRTSGCRPSRTYHPKAFMMVGSQRTTIICGSGNLSRNGLTQGCEIGGVATFMLPRGSTGAMDARVETLLRWFRAEWKTATPYPHLAERYEAACKTRVRDRAIVPSDDDVRPRTERGTRRGRPLTEEQIHELRTYNNFWIDAGPLGANFGSDKPGNQLDMKRYTRAFFGAPVEDIPPQEKIDEIILIWEGTRYRNRTLKYGDNHMDKLNVPPSGERGPVFYRGKTLLFTRRADGAYDFSAGSASQRRQWKRASKRSGVFYRLSAKREWGLF